MANVLVVWHLQPLVLTRRPGGGRGVLVAVDDACKERPPASVVGQAARHATHETWFVTQRARSVTQHECECAGRN